MPELLGVDIRSHEHLKTCARCAALLDELEYIASIASDLLLPVYEPRESVWQKIHASLPKANVAGKDQRTPENIASRLVPPEGRLLPAPQCVAFFIIQATIMQPEQPIPLALERIVLVGFMGAGKSTIGPLLAERLGWRFIDADHQLQLRDPIDHRRFVQWHWANQLSGEWRPASSPGSSRSAR